MNLWTNKVLLCPSTKVALAFYLQCYKNIYIHVVQVPNLYLLFKKRNTAKGKHGLNYCFFPMCKPFSSLWKKPLYILMEKYPFPGRAKNMYQTGKKKKKKFKKTLFFSFLGWKTCLRMSSAFWAGNSSIKATSEGTETKLHSTWHCLTQSCLNSIMISPNNETLSVASLG